MVPQNTKVVLGAAPATVANNETATLVIDRLGYDYVSVKVLAGTAANTNKATAFAVTESDDATNYSAIVSLTGTTNTAVTAGTNGFLIPATLGTTTTNRAYAILNIDCKARKRYLKVSITPATNQGLCLVADLYRAKEAPVGAAAQNACVVVNA